MVQGTPLAHAAIAGTGDIAGCTCQVRLYCTPSHIFQYTKPHLPVHQATSSGQRQARTRQPGRLAGRQADRQTDGHRGSQARREAARQAACMPICLSACLPICLSACLPVCLSACLHVCMSASSLPVCLPTCLPVYLSPSCQPACPPVRYLRAFHLPVCPALLAGSNSCCHTPGSLCLRLYTSAYQSAKQIER